MKSLILIICLGIYQFSIAQVTLREKQRYMAVIEKGQKLFISESDFVNDKIYEVTKRIDTVEVISASSGFFKFSRKRGGAKELMGLTKKLDVRKLFVIPAVYDVKFPFEHTVHCYVDGYLVYGYNSPEVSSGKSLIENQTSVTIVGEEKDFFLAETDGSNIYVHKSNIYPPQDEHPIRTALNLNGVVSSTIGRKQETNQGSPQSNESKATSTSKTSPQSTSRSHSTSSVQCSGMTKKGTRCRNMTTNASGRCHLH